MMLESGRLQVTHIRQRRVYIFPVGKETDWCIRFITLSEYPIPLDNAYKNGAVVQLGHGYDNKELEVSETFVICYYMYTYVSDSKIQFAMSCNGER